MIPSWVPISRLIPFDFSSATFFSFSSRRFSFLNDSKRAFVICGLESTSPASLSSLFISSMLRLSSSPLLSSFMNSSWMAFNPFGDGSCFSSFSDLVFSSATDSSSFSSSLILDSASVICSRIISGGLYSSFSTRISVVKLASKFSNCFFI